MCGELDSSVDSSVIKIARLILCTHMDIFIALLIDYTCTNRLIDPAKSSLIEKPTYVEPRSAPASSQGTRSEQKTGEEPDEKVTQSNGIDNVTFKLTSPIRKY